MNFKLVGQELKYIPSTVVGDSVNYEYAEFELTEEFLTGTITAYFRTYTSPPTETPVILTDGKCLVPEAHLKGKHVYVWLTRLSGDIFVPTTIAKLPINASGANGETYLLPEMQENLYEAVVRMYNEFIAGGGNGAISITANATANTLLPTDQATATAEIINNVLEITLGIPQGVQGIQGIQGEVGPQGIQGIKGDTGPQGIQGIAGTNGVDGVTPVKGQDYFTPAEIALIENNVVNAVQPQLTKYCVDFLQANSVAPWAASSVNSGTFTNSTAGVKHPGVMSFSSSVTANSGYYIILQSGTISLSGGEKSTIVFKTSAILTGVTRQMGFHETTGAATTVDGVFGEIVDGVISGKTSSNSVGSATVTNYTLSANTWYRFVVELNSDASLVTFTLYADDSDTVLWSDTLSTNIPTGSGRETRHGDIVTYSGTSVTTLGYIDYIDVMLNARKV